MSFSAYLEDYLYQRVSQERALVVHDPKEQFRSICQNLDGRGVTIVDASGPTTETREQLVRLWTTMPQDSSARLLVYRPEPAADNEREKLADPLGGFEQLAGLFPQPGIAHEDYRSLALCAYPDHCDEVEALFADGEPTVAILDTLATGDRYPSLAGLTGHSGPIDILVYIMSSDRDVLELMLATASAAKELTDLLRSAIGLTDSLPLSDGDEATRVLWRFVLFSEFVLDLPVETPSAFHGIPCAPEEKRDTIFRLCERLRSTILLEYVERAEEIERELDLRSTAGAISEFGEIDTFAFENAAALRNAVAAIVSQKSQAAEPIVQKGRASKWAEYDSTLRSTWQVLGEALKTLDALAIAPASDAADDPVDWYCASGKNVDRTYRSFILSYSRLEDDTPYGANLGELADVLGRRYREWVDHVQSAFIARVRWDGWPLPGLQQQERLFASSVESQLKDDKRVAYFLVDALRYELGEALGNKLEPEHRVVRDAAAALLPTKTPLGMAALGPANGDSLAVILDEGDWKVWRGSHRLATASDRDAEFRAHLGDQVLVETLETWLKRGSKKSPDEKIRLAVVRSTEIDAAGEQAESVFRASLENLMAQLALGVRHAFTFGFDVAVVTADHGFLYIPVRAPGDQVSVPAGNVMVKGDRYAFGRLEENPSVLIFDGSSLGYGLPDACLALPVSTGSFVKPGAYVHGGLSIQEALIPVLTVERVVARKQAKITVDLTYRKRKEAKVTSLTPTVTVSVSGSDYGLDFGDEWGGESVEIDLTVVNDSDGATVGKIGPNEFLDADTGYLRIRPGTKTTIPLRLGEEHRGICVVRAADPATGKTHDSIRLDVDILE